MKPAIKIESDRVNRLNRPPRIALWALGFRPFYLGGALFGSIAMLLWLGALAAWPALDAASYMSGTLWHVHEMIFGFGAAIVAGFLLTAVRAWTSMNPARMAPVSRRCGFSGSRAGS